MRITPLRGLVGSYGRLIKGKSAVIDDVTAKKLIEKGLVLKAGKQEAGDKAAVNPSQPKGPAGGQRGKPKQSSSSAADPAPNQAPSN